MTIYKFIMVIITVKILMKNILMKKFKWRKLDAWIFRKDGNKNFKKFFWAWDFKVPSWNIKNIKIWEFFKLGFIKFHFLKYKKFFLELRKFFPEIYEIFLKKFHFLKCKKSLFNRGVIKFYTLKYKKKTFFWENGKKCS